MTTQTRTTRPIIDTLRAHQGSWDSWGWHCSCGATEELSDMPLVLGANPGKGAAALDGLLAHQADALSHA